MSSVPSITYSLSGKDRDAFYGELSDFTDGFLASLDGAVQEELTRFRHYIEQEGIEEARSEQEYLIEFLALGLFSRIYSGHAERSSGLLLSVMSQLFHLRTRFPGMKPTIDKLRGQLIGGLLHDEAPAASPTFRALTRLLRWLDATGDFREEVERLRHWQRYLETLEADRAAALFAQAVALADNFRKQAHHALGTYTTAVDVFLQQCHPAYRRREDYVLCGRREAEYHLNMFGAEILNRALRSRFVHTAHKVVLLPTCMCAPGQGECRAQHRGLAITCTSCTATCQVNKMRALLLRAGAATFLIPHSSSFSQFLEMWKDQKDVGLVGVACVLNLLTGGYEMLKLGIASQCVFLNYAGCRKHWHPDGIPTNLNARQLLQIVSAKPSVSVKP